MRNTPVKVLIIILLTEVLLVGYSFFYSTNGNNFIKQHIRFMTPQSLIDFTLKDNNEVADSLLQNYLANTVSDDLILKRTSLSKIGPKKQNIFLVNPDIDSTSDGQGCKALDNFFKYVLEEKDSMVVRIAHYGDSQLEGDRMSYMVRDKFHEKFGGSGIGYVPLKDLTPVSYIRKSSGNWAKYTVFHDRNKGNNYGLSGTVCRFYKYYVRQNEDMNPGDSATVKDSQPVVPSIKYFNASVSLKMSSKYTYNTVSFLYGHNEENCVVNFYNNVSGDIIKTDTLKPCDHVCLYRSHVGATLNVKLEFNADQSPDFYGLYFDSPNGVQVDNYAIRGHSGDGLMLINDAQLKEMLALTNTKLIIFQYGANVVPYIRSDEACEWLCNLYYKLFMKFKKADPELSILVIGAGDMAHGGESGYSSYSWLPKITAAQKKAALKAGCAYWDLFNMMGGTNSIMAWSEKKLAVPNGHFSEKGQKIISNELVEALMIEYNIFIHKQRNNHQ